MDTEAELRKMAESYMEARNETPVEDFLGLTPAEMQQLLYTPFDAPEIVVFPAELPDDLNAPLLDLFTQLAAFLAEGPLKLTQAGNLPVAVCTAIHQNYQPGFRMAWKDERQTNIREGDFPDLHVTHVVGKLAGLLNKRNGKLNLTARARKLLDQEGPAGVYSALFRTFVSKYNWGYMDGYQELHIIQQSWAFSCFMLQRDGHVEQPADLYASRFLQAFPLALQEVPEQKWRSAEDYLKDAYSIRTLTRFMGFLGLADPRYEPSPTGLRSTKMVTRRPLLMQLMDFQVR